MDGPVSERGELLLVLSRLVDALENVRRNARSGTIESAPMWSDRGHLYLETGLDTMPDDYLDICVHSGRLFLVSARWAGSKTA